MATASPDHDRIEEILTFWFGELDALTDVDRSKNQLWWSGGASIDAEIEERFGAWVEAACEGQLRSWMETARGCLALVILLDQCTRSIGRGTRSAFRGDAEALRVSLHAQASGYDRELRPIERAFLYMPMMHAEDPDMAHRSVQTFEQLSEEIAQLGIDGYPDFRSHAAKHADIVLRFGRYPHRNEQLGRTSTPAEASFLAAGAPTYGQGARS